MSDQLNRPYQDISEDEISIRDVIEFIQSSWKVIFGTGLLGLALGFVFLVLMPNQYESVAQIQMAQVSTTNNNNNINPLGSNIEDPNLLTARMKLPTSYTPEVAKACGIEGVDNPSEVLASIVKLAPVKGVNSVVELRIRRSSEEGALYCTQLVFELIHQSQKEITSPFIKEAQSKLEDYSKRLGEAKAVVERADKSGAALSAAYLSTRDEIKYWSDEIKTLNDFIASGQTRHTKLVSPIYVSKDPVFPKKRLSLIVGLFTGIFIGVLVALLRRVWTNYQKK